MQSWTHTDSADLYGIPHWGREFLRVSPDGHLVIAPDGPEGARAIDLKALVDDLRQRDIGLPILVRFTDLIDARVDVINNAFATAIRGEGYGGVYRGVYPIKVNQQRHLVEELLRAGRRHHMGLEAGSKPELLVVMALLEDPEAVIVCNGYKDVEYIETALYARRLGHRPFIVIEKATEIDLCIEVSRRLGIRPLLGMRAKLSSRGSGRWEASAGDKAKFGLTTLEVVAGIEKLRDAGMLDCLQLLHFHIGSQVSAIRSFKDALREAARIYVEMVKLGAPMGFFDAGGGLGVDYDGSHTNFASSVNYTVDEYALDVVSAIQVACDEHDVPHPTLVTESGRALVAHHAMLVLEVMGASERAPKTTPVVPGDDDPDVLHDLHNALESVNRKSYQAAWHDALAARSELLNRFNLGLVDLQQRAWGEQIFWQVARRVGRILPDLSYVPDEFEYLQRNLADTYFCNFSVFQSMPDSWAVDQLFPIVPIHRLDEKPTRRATLADITCDSDGKVDRFIDLHDVKDALELHKLRADEAYYLGVFLLGAYQEILGDLHNLFGDTNTVMVRAAPGGGYHLDHVVQGETVAEVLTYMQYDRKGLAAAMRRSCEDAVRKGRMGFEDTARLMAIFQEGLDGYTYLE